MVFIQILGQGDGNPYLATVGLGNIMTDLSQLASQIRLCRLSVLESALNAQNSIRFFII